MTTMQCNKCSLDINKGELYAICEWRCGKSFHAKCSNLSEDAAYTVQRKNIMWMCDDCVVDFRRTRDKLNETSLEVVDEPSTTEQEISDLKAQVAEISEVLSTLTSQRISSGTYDQLHSTPVSSLSLLDGTRVLEHEGSFIETAASGNVTQRSQNKFSLFLTNIDFHTTENDIRVLASQSLGIVEPNRLRVRKLVPRWRSYEETDSISFKVILDTEFKAVAMDPSTWPRGVKYREFVERCNTWKPNQ